MNCRTAGLLPAAVVLSAFAIGQTGLATAAPVDVKGVKPITLIEGISEYELPNGLRVLLFPDASKPTVTVNMTIMVGSRQEGYGETGMAHLLEHMLFKGSRLYPDPTSIPAAMKERGALSNASTWLDRTNYHETLPASDANLDFAIQLEADRLVNSYIRGADLKSEMTVVRNEFEMGENDPEGILLQRMMAVAYEWHNYGKSTIGNRADIERVPIENLHEFYTRFYQPDNAILSLPASSIPRRPSSWRPSTSGRSRVPIGSSIRLIPRSRRRTASESYASAAWGALQSWGPFTTFRPAAILTFPRRKSSPRFLRMIRRDGFISRWSRRSWPRA